jgi:ElaB/YqjD/DUF883 family membrane-anchored ribosome-binding protein
MGSLRAMQTYRTQTSNGPTTADPGSTTDQAKEKAQQVSDQARSRLRSQVDQRSTEAGQRVAGFASDTRSVGEELRRQGKDQPAKLADQAADRAERLGDYLERSDADRILRDVEDFGRRQPWVVIAGGVALGIVASRFLKASSRDRYAQLPERSSGIHPEPISAGPAAPAPVPGYGTSSLERSG